MEGVEGGEHEQGPRRSRRNVNIDFRSMANGNRVADDDDEDLDFAAGTQ